MRTPDLADAWHAGLRAFLTAARGTSELYAITPACLAVLSPHVIAGEPAALRLAGGIGLFMHRLADGPPCCCCAKPLRTFFDLGGILLLEGEDPRPLATISAGLCADCTIEIVGALDDAEGLADAVAAALPVVAPGSRLLGFVHAPGHA